MAATPAGGSEFVATRGRVRHRGAQPRQPPAIACARSPLWRTWEMDTCVTSIGLVAPGHDADVDVENRAGDPAGPVGEQIGDGVGDVGGGADSSQRVKRRESL